MIDFYKLMKDEKYSILLTYMPAYPVIKDGKDKEPIIPSNNAIVRYLPSGETQWNNELISDICYGVVPGTEMLVKSSEKGQHDAGQYKNLKREGWYLYLPNSNSRGALIGIMPKDRPFACSSGQLSGCTFCTISFNNGAQGICIHIGKTRKNEEKYDQEMKNRDLVFSVALYLGLFDEIMDDFGEGEQVSRLSEKQMAESLIKILDIYGKMQKCKSRVFIYAMTEEQEEEKMKLEKHKGATTKISIGYYHIKGGIIFSGCNSKKLDEEDNHLHYNDSYKTFVLQNCKGELVEFKSVYSDLKVYTGLSEL